MGNAPYYEKSKNKSNVYAVTYEEHAYSWDATSTDTGLHPNTQTIPFGDDYDEYNQYNGWEHGYPQ